MLVEERVRQADERPSEAELQAIAKAEFQNQLARYCDMQREHPQHRAMHSAANLAYADYCQRMIDTGGRPRMTPALRRKMLGWARRRGTTVLLGHLRDVAGFAELSVSIWLCDGGVVALENYNLFTTDARKFWLVAQPGHVLFSLTHEGLVPTLSEPWLGGVDELMKGIAYAEDLLAAVIWED